MASSAGKRKRINNAARHRRSLILSDDSLPVLPCDSWTNVFSFSNNSELRSNIPLVCRDFREICTRADEFLWKPRCLALWCDKVESSWKDIFNDRNLLFCQKYVKSVRDSRRSELTAFELCSFTWAFRFKEAAGEWWTTVDPYWNSDNGAPQINVYRNSDDETAIMVRRFLPNGEICNPGPPDEIENYAEDNNIRLHWRFTKTRRSSRDKVVRRGHFLKLNQWPSSGIERSENWGWVIQNQWIAYVYPARDIFRMHEELESDVDRWV